MKNTGTVTRFGCNFNVLKVTGSVQHFSYLGETTNLVTEEHPEVTDIENCLSCINVMLYIANHIEAYIDRHNIQFRGGRTPESY